MILHLLILKYPEAKAWNWPEVSFHTNSSPFFRPFLSKQEEKIDEVIDQIEDVADKLDDFVTEHDKDE